MARPLKVLHHEPSDQGYMVNGRLVRAERIVYDRESTERIRQGYACAKCMEPFETAWPRSCPFCGAPVAARQSEYLARELDIQIMQIGPRTSLAEELAGLHERVAEEEAKAKERKKR